MFQPAKSSLRTGGGQFLFDGRNLLGVTKVRPHQLIVWFASATSQNVELKKSDILQLEKKNSDHCQHVVITTNSYIFFMLTLCNCSFSSSLISYCEIKNIREFSSNILVTCSWYLTKLFNMPIWANNQGFNKTCVLFSSHC